MSITTWTGIDPANRITCDDPVDLKGYVGVTRDADRLVDTITGGPLLLAALPCVPRYDPSLMPGGRIWWAAGVFLVVVCSCAGTHSSTGSSAGGSSVGGRSGEGGSGGESMPTCSALYSQYQVALSLAKACSVGAAGQCEHMGPLVYPGCPSNCMTPVNDTSMLNQLLPQWRDAGCETSTTLVCAGGCQVFSKGNCASGDGGVGQCVGE